MFGCGDFHTRICSIEVIGITFEQNLYHIVANGMPVQRDSPNIKQKC